ncbi:MAG: DUF2804 domain-containing protein [Halanaerobiales bacterium]
MTRDRERYSEREIKDKVKLCDDEGRLNPDAVGWSKQPIYRCNLSGSWPRKKKWNYWSITGPDCLFSVTVSNVDYVGLVFMYFLDFKTEEFLYRSIIVPFGRGCSLPETVNETVEFKHREMLVSFIHHGSQVKIKVECPDIQGRELKADLCVSYPEGHETINVVIPWSSKKFQFTSKQECLPVSGTMNIGKKNYYFETENSFGCLDFGRGIWPYRVSWNWANASGKVDGRCIGLNLGAKWTDGTGMTENGFIIDGRVTKLSENIIFDYNSSDLMKPWTIKTAVTDRVDLVFTPFFKRVDITDLLFVKTEMNQLIGTFSGTIKTDSDETIAIEELTGCSEEHYGRW